MQKSKGFLEIVTVQWQEIVLAVFLAVSVFETGRLASPFWCAAY